MAASRVMVILLVLVPLVAMVSAEEGDATAVEDLGEAVGRRAGRVSIRRFTSPGAFNAGMSTSGFFQVGFQGNHEEDTNEVSSQAEELGESRSRSQSKVRIGEADDEGLFQLIVTASRSEVEAIKRSAEAILAEKQAAKAVAGGKGSGFDWTQCKSEGGSKNCALCSDVEGGVLPCHQAAGHKKALFSCPDTKIMARRKYFLVHGSGKSKCVPLASKVVLEGVATSTWNFPTFAPNSTLVLSKVLVTHPNKASKKVGVVMFKRLVTHTCTGKKPAFCKNGTTVADVHKQGFCVHCDYDVFDYHAEHRVQDKHRRSFVQNCLRKAVDEKTGNIKEKFQCKGEDKKYAMATISGF